MKLTLPLFFLLALSCGPNSATHTVSQVRDFGLLHQEQSRLGVKMNLDDFEDMQSVYAEAQTIRCRDSIPMIEFATEDEIRRLYLKMNCFEYYHSVVNKVSNILRVRNDSLFKSRDFIGPLDSLVPILRYDLGNYGKDPNYSDAPDKVMVWVSCDGGEAAPLHSRLSRVLDAYEILSDTTDIPVFFIQDQTR